MAHVSRADPVERVDRPVRSIVVPVEGSTQERLAQHWAVGMASALAVPLRGVHVATGPEDPPEDIFDYLEEQSARRGVEFRAAVLHGRDVATELLDELSATDLVVIGTRLLGTEYHLGSVTERLIRASPCPVQVYRLR